ncbi:hypothetical protein QUF58_09575 [Anaerolineales bacterium HSG24]|nr:hypothetical protein [Anaerolineales bacterium HSG24]
MQLSSNSGIDTYPSHTLLSTLPRRVGYGLIFIFLGLLLFILNRGQPVPPAIADGGRVKVVSINSQGEIGTGESNRPVISYDGRYIAFESSAKNLVSSDTNGLQDVFVYDQSLNQMHMVSVASDGTQSNGISSYAAISGDGRFVGFISTADNLVENDDNRQSDLFIHDTWTKMTEIVSVATDGTQGNKSTFNRSAISFDGQVVAFQSTSTNLIQRDINNVADVFVRDRQQNITTLASISSEGVQGNGGSLSPSVSGDGRFVAFRSFASSLTRGDTNNTFDILVHDRNTAQTNRVSIAPDGGVSNGNSLDAFIAMYGRYVSFQSKATNLIANDTNSMQDVFLYDMDTGQTILMSVTSNGTQANRESNQLAPVSGLGRSAVFQTVANNLVSSDTNGHIDIFVHDQSSQLTDRVSVSTTGEQGSMSSSYPYISANGRYVTFVSEASNLVPNDDNRKLDIFVYDRGVAEPTATPTTTPSPTPSATSTPSPTPTKTSTPTITPTPTSTPTPFSALITKDEGGVLPSHGVDTNLGVTIYFPPQAVLTDTLVTYHYQLPQRFPPMIAIDKFFSLETFPPLTQTSLPITVVIRYTDQERGAALANGISLYRQQDGLWVTNDLLQIARTDNALTNTTRYIASYGVWGDTLGIYLPVITRP